MAKVTIQTESVNINSIDEHIDNAPEKEGAIYRVCYLESGINSIVLDEKIDDSLQCHTTGKANETTGKLRYYYSVKCIAPSGNVFRLYLSSFDGVAFVAPYKLLKDGKYNGKVKAIRLTDDQVGDANLAYRGVTTQVEFIRLLLEHTDNGICKIDVKIIGVGSENPKANGVVAVERDWDSNDSKVYTLKGVKHLYSISFVD